MVSPDLLADRPRPASRRAALAAALALVASFALGACRGRERRQDTLVAVVSVDDDSAKRIDELASRYRVDRSRAIDLRRVAAPEVLAALKRGEADVGVVEPSPAVGQAVDDGEARSAGTLKLNDARYLVLVVNPKTHPARDAHGSSELAAFMIAGVVR